MDNSGEQNTSFESAGESTSPTLISRGQQSVPQRPAASYSAQFSPSRQQSIPERPIASAPVASALAPTPQPNVSSVPPRPKARSWPAVSAFARRIALVVAGLVLFLGIGVGAYVLWHVMRGEQVVDAPVTSAVAFDIQQLPLGDLGADMLPTLQGSRKLSINGLLEVKNTLIVAPSGQPTSAVPGQIYYDQDTNVLNYYNGSEFIPVSDADQTVNTIGGLSGSIALGAGLSIADGQLTSSGVVSLQASGPITSSGGQNPVITLADGTAAGQFWQWDGDSWELASAPTSEVPTPDEDGVIGNEVTGVIVGGGLIVQGGATAADPLRVGLEACALDEVLKSNGSGGWICASDAGGTNYSAGNGLNLAAGQFSVNSPACSGTDKLQWNGSAFVCAADVDTDTNTTYSAGTGLALNGTTFSNSGTLSVSGSGPLTSSGGQTPNLTFANGTVNGQFWQWNGSAWALALLPAAQDSVVGNEVLNATANQGLVRSGAGTALDPFTLGLSTCANEEILKSTGSGWACAADGTGGGVTYSADGEGIVLNGTIFSLELDGTSLQKSASGLGLNTANPNTWTATQTFGAGLVVAAGQSVTVNGDVITDMTGTGLTVAGGALQTTLGISVDLGSEVVGTLPIANGGTGLTTLGSAHQLLGVNGAGTSLEYKNIGSLLAGGTGISVSGTNTVTITNGGVLSVAGSGPLTSTGGQNPSLTFASGSSNGQFWQWNGSAWALASLPSEQDAVVGNEVTGPTGSNAGLTRSGSGTSGNPYTLAVTTGNGLQVTSNAVGVDSPTCSGTDKLQWSGTAFVCTADVDTDTNTTYSTISNGGLRLVGTQFGLGICASGEALKATAVSGEWACGATGDGNTTYSADGQGIELTGTTFSLELNGASLSKSASGLTLNVANANTWTGAQTFNAGATVGTGQALTVNGEAFTDLTGTGLTVNTGSLQATLGVSVDLTTEVVGTLPVGNGGTGLNALGTSNQLLGVDAAGTSLEYKNLSSLLSAGTGVGLSGTNTVTVENTGVLSVVGSGPIASTGGQTPTLTFADGTTPGEFWRWDGDSWELASLPAEQDAVIGNEVTGGTGSNSGLIRSGSGTSGSPYTLAVNPGNGLQVSSNALGISSPTCSGTDKLQWSGTAFVCTADVDTDTNTTYSTISNGGLRLVGTQFGLGVCAQNQILKATAVSGEWACAADDDANTTYTADGQGIELTGTTFSLELDGTTLSKSGSGLTINLGRANSWTGTQTFGAGVVVTTGQSMTVNGEAFTDLTGTGLTISAGALTATLGTSVDLTTEVVGTLPVVNGGTGLNALGTAGQILNVNGGGTALQYSNVASFLTAGSGISLGGTSNVTIDNSGVLSVGSSTHLTSSGGQNPTLSFTNGTTAGQFWRWNGSAWSLTNDLGTVVTCNATGNFVCIGGNTKGASMTLGTNDANTLIFETNNVSAFTIASGGASTFQNATNGTSAFRILKSAGAEVFSVDTVNNRVTIGNVASGTGAGGRLYFGDFGTGNGNLFIGESGTTDTDILQLHGIDGLSFTVNSGMSERMTIDNNGVSILGSGTASAGGRLYVGDLGPVWIGEYSTTDTDALQLHGEAGIYMSYGASSTRRVKLDAAGLTVSNDLDAATNRQIRMRTNGGDVDLDVSGGNLFIGAWQGDNYTGTQHTGFIIYRAESRVDVKSSYTFFNPTTSPSGTLVDFNRNTAGTLLGFALNGAIQGSVSVSGSTVSYNAFTGSHHAWSDQQLARGELVRMTGNNKHRPGQEEAAEPTYGVERTMTPNDPAVMGTYLDRVNPSLAFNMFDNPNLVAAVGNGDMWVVDDGEAIQPGDYLISSDVAGHAMKDEGQYQTSYVVARAAQAVDWSVETSTINGRKHKKISVLYGSFEKFNMAALQQGVFSGGLVANDTTFNGFVTFNKSVSFTGDATFHGDATFNRNVVFSSNTAGSATVRAAQKTVTVTFERDHAEVPVVNITPREFVGGNYRVRDVTKHSFVIELSQAQANDTTFNWSALSAQAAN